MPFKLFLGRQELGTRGNGATRSARSTRCSTCAQSASSMRLLLSTSSLACARWIKREEIRTRIRDKIQANTLDREYTLEYGLGKQDGVARPFLKGRMNTNIKYNITSKMWEMRHLHSPNYALLTDPRAKGGRVYPIGRFSNLTCLHPLTESYSQGTSGWSSILSVTRSTRRSL